MATTDRPWMTALEMQFAAMGHVRDHQISPKSVGANLQVSMLKEAETYSWDLSTITAVALASRTVPLSSTVPVTLPGHSGWWWFGVTEVLPFAALLWSAHAGDPCLTIYGIDTEDTRSASDHFRPRPLRMGFWDRGHSLGDTIARDQRQRAADLEIGDEAHPRFASGDLADEHTRPLLAIALRFFVASCSWLNQRIIGFTPGHIERHRRKQLAREHDAPLPSDVKVIQLRRRESSTTPPTTGETSVDWSCRWVVSGHWRNQPYKDARQLIYIMPFVKGPADKPLRVPTHTVYQVTR